MSEKDAEKAGIKADNDSEKVNKTTHIELFKKLGNYNNGKTRFVNTTEFIGDFSVLVCKNGGGWCRFDSVFGKKYKICTIKCSGETRYSPNCSGEDKNQVNKEIAEMNFQKVNGNKIQFIKIIGIPENIDNSTRTIRSDIRAHFTNKLCVNCGNSNIEIDHKNGLYNNSRVNTISTQSIDDFQALCKHCNDQKRQTYVWQNKNKKRYPSTNIPKLEHFGIKYTSGNETFDPNDPNAMIGTYWYDPVDFMKQLIILSKP